MFKAEEDFNPPRTIDVERLCCMAVGFNLQLWPKAKRLRDRKQWPQARASFFERSEKNAGPSDPTNGSRRSEASNSELRHSPTRAKGEGQPQKKKILETLLVRFLYIRSKL